MENNLKINCALCDARKVREETLAAYDQVDINAATVLVTPETRALLSRYPATLNCAEVLDIAEGVEFRIVNGSTEIHAEDAGKGKTFLMVNGSVTIGPDAGEALKQYVKILVNGSALCPRSLAAQAPLEVNGSLSCYPDGAIVLKRTAILDKTFVLRAKPALYWAAKRLVFVDGGLDPAALAAKGARFSASEAILAESLAEGLVPLLDEQTSLTVVPDGTAIIRDDVNLGSAVKRYGSKLYILGDLTVDKDSQKALERLTYLTVRGDVTVPEELEDLLMAIPGELTGEIRRPKRKGEESLVITDLPKVSVTGWLLKHAPYGLTVEDCQTVIIGKDVDKELILARLHICDCQEVLCTPEQADAVTAVCEDVAAIGEPDAQPGKKARVINAAEYVL